jgi:hypothetical protein
MFDASLFGGLFSGESEQQAQRRVDGVGVLEDFGYVRIEKNDVRPPAVGLMMLPTNTSGEVVLRAQLAITLWILTHILVFLWESPPVR